MMFKIAFAFWSIFFGLCNNAWSQTATALLLDARKFISTTNVAPSDGATLNSYGAVIHNAPPYTERPNAVRYNIEISQPGEFELRIKYAAASPRPVLISVNGKEITSSALSKVTGCWEFRCQAWSDPISVTFVSGKNELVLSSPSIFPHISLLEVLAKKVAPANAANLPAKATETPAAELFTVDWCDNNYSQLPLVNSIEPSTTPPSLAILGIRLGSDADEWYAAMQKILGGKEPDLRCSGRSFRAVLPSAVSVPATYSDILPGTNRPPTGTDRREFMFPDVMAWDFSSNSTDSAGRISSTSNDLHLRLSSPISGYRMLAIKRYASFNPATSYASLEQEIRATHGQPTEVTIRDDRRLLTYMWNRGVLLSAPPQKRCDISDVVRNGATLFEPCMGVTSMLTVDIHVTNQSLSLANSLNFIAADIQGLADDNAAFKRFILANQPPPQSGMAPKL